MWTVETTTTVIGGSGATSCQAFAASASGSVVIHYSASDGSTGHRAGHLILNWTAGENTVALYDSTTDTTANTLVFSATKSLGIMTLWGTASSGTWTVQAMRIATTKA